MRMFGSAVGSAFAPVMLQAARNFSMSTAASAAAKVGFIGLGHLGARMVPRLLDAGHDVVLHDNNKLAVMRALEIGEQHPNASVFVADSPAKLASTEGVDVLFTSVPSVDAVKDVYLSNSGVLAAHGGVVPSLLVNMSTVDPATARQLAAAAATTPRSKQSPPLAGLPVGYPTFLDAPVSGGIVAADSGTLNFMVGCSSDSALQAAEPFLRVLGSSITRVGNVGAGSAAKLCNTLVAASSMAAVSEALALGRRLGLEPATLTRVLNSGSGRCWASEAYNPVPGVQPGAPSSNSYRAGLGVDMVLSQLMLLIQAAEGAESPVPVARSTQQLYNGISEEGLGDKDFSCIYRYQYGQGCNNMEWQEGQQLFSAQIP